MDLVYDLSNDETPSEGVVRAVAAVAGLEAVPTSPGGASVDALEPLHETLDPDALDGLFSSADGSSRRVAGLVSFCYHGCAVTVYGDGRVTVDTSG